MAFERVEPKQITFREKYDRDLQSQLDKMRQTGLSSPRQLTVAKPRWTGSSGMNLVDNPAYVDTSKGDVWRYAGDKISYAPKGSTYYTDEDVTESDLTPGMFGSMRESASSLAGNPFAAVLEAKFKGLMGSETGKKIAASDPVKFGGGSSHALAPDVLSKMWK